MLTSFYADLKEAKEVAEAAAASKQNFLANMSHGNFFIRAKRTCYGAHATIVFRNPHAHECCDWHVTYLDGEQLAS